jgi:hypothetical protein
MNKKLLALYNQARRDSKLHYDLADDWLTKSRLPTEDHNSCRQSAYYHQGRAFSYWSMAEDLRVILAL